MKKFLLIIPILVLLAAILTAYAYHSQANSSFAVFLHKAFPALIIGNHTISIYDYDENLKIAQSFDAKIDSTNAADRLVQRLKMQILAKGQGIRVTDDERSKELAFYTKGKAAEYEKLIKDHFSGNSGLFMKYVVYPKAVEAALRIKYNSDFGANAAEYDKANDILSQISSGKSFEDLAKSQSDDKQSGQFGGDLGFFEDGDLIPELDAKIKQSPTGEVLKEIFVSRLGYHIIYPVETAEKDGKTLWHAKHILIQTQGFEKWAEKQALAIKVWHLK
ncbi:MAG TPA: peptidylprolyl isomerase [Patescibacteria group bacterium]|jgi:hypothetical protein|nr:peptidylprolyl isomerase [Patescibacteria group bacterium]